MKKILIISALLLAGFWFFGAADTVPISNATSPEALAAQIINSEKAGLQTKRTGKDSRRLVINYSLDPWAITAGTIQSTFLRHVRSFVPNLFQRFPDVDVVEMRGSSTFTDQRGQKSVDEALMVVFFRSNATSINWNNIRDENIMKEADASIVHPGLLKHLNR